MMNCKKKTSFEKLSVCVMTVTANVPEAREEAVSNTVRVEVDVKEGGSDTDVVGVASD